MNRHCRGKEKREAYSRQSEWHRQRPCGERRHDEYEKLREACEAGVTWFDKNWRLAVVCVELGGLLKKPFCYYFILLRGIQFNG